MYFSNPQGTKVHTLIFLENLTLILFIQKNIIPPKGVKLTDKWEDFNENLDYGTKYNLIQTNSIRTNFWKLEPSGNVRNF